MSARDATRAAAILGAADGLTPIEPPTKAGVYFVEAIGLVKIGYANNIARRCRELGTASPRRPKLLAWLPGNRSLETELHRRFRALREHGEWFAPSFAFLLYIAWVRGGRPPMAIPMIDAVGAIVDEGTAPPEWLLFEMTRPRPLFHEAWFGPSANNNEVAS